MSTPPPPGRSRNIDYPAFPPITWDGDLELLCVSDSHLPRLTLCLALPFGRVGDPDDRRGLAQIAVEMLKEGTSSRTSRQIAEELDRLALDYETEVNMECALLSASFLEQHTERALAIFADMVRNPSFPEAELEKVKVRWGSLLMAQRSDPGFLANERCYAGLFSGHPYSKVSIPPQDLQAVDRDQLVSFHRSHFPGRPARLLFAGPIDPDRAARLAERYFHGWSPGDAIEPAYPHLKPFTGPRVDLVDRPHSVQAKIVVGLRSPARRDPDYASLRVANQVLGGGASARLFLNLREQKGYTYGVYSSLRGYRESGVLAVGTSVRTENALEAIGEIVSEMGGIAGSPPRDEELDRCKAEIVGTFIRRMETPGSIGQMELTRRLNGLPSRYYSDFIPSVWMVSAEQVAEIASRWLRPERSTIVVVGDGRLLREGLATVGPVSVYDPTGRPLPQSEDRPAIAGPQEDT
jgi:zinc protease